MSDKKPVRTLEMQVDIDAPIEEAWKALTTGPGLANWFAPVGEVSGPGAGATVKSGWSPEMMMSVTVGAWEPLKHVSWIDESGWTGPGTSMVCDYYLSTEQGKTRVRFVQSAFGASEACDDLFDGMEVGWTYFLFNLRAYLELHAGRTRRMISERLEVTAGRQKFWRHLLSALVGSAGSVKAGDKVPVKLSDAPTPGIVEVAIERHALGVRLPELANALLFVELEGKSDQFHVGYWFSVYDDDKAHQVDAPARKAFRGLHEPQPKA